MVRLDGSGTTLLLLQRARLLPEIVYWGARLPDGIDLAGAATLRDRATRRNGLDADHVEAVLMPTLGTGSLRAPGLAASRGSVDWTADFTEVAVTAEPGAVRIVASDPVAALVLEIELALRPDCDLLSMRTSLRNAGAAPLQVERLAAGVFLLPAGAGELLVFDGHWGHEFAERRIALASGVFASENRRGRSHDRFPAIIAGTPGFDEDRGLVHGIHLGWSGNHRTTAERLEDGRLLVVTGEWYQPGEVVLQAGETLRTPLSYASLSPDGLSGLSRRFHDGVRAGVLRWPGGAMRPRPVTLNTWEGNYFTHDHDRLVAQARAAAALGVERFVLDDGWMSARDHERAGLGDWVADPRKYPDGLGKLIAAVTEAGLEFGLWVEPEMVNPDSDLYRAHPDAVLRVPGRPAHLSRHQLILDLTRPEIADHVFAQLDRLLGAHAISYLKWDMNRDFVAAGDRVRPARLPPRTCSPTYRAASTRLCRCASRASRSKAAPPAAARADLRHAAPHQPDLDVRLHRRIGAAGDPAWLLALPATGADGRARRCLSQSPDRPAGTRLISAPRWRCSAIWGSSWTRPPCSTPPRNRHQLRALDRSAQATAAIAARRASPRGDADARPAARCAAWSREDQEPRRLPGGAGTYRRAWRAAPLA